MFLFAILAGTFSLSTSGDQVLVFSGSEAGVSVGWFQGKPRGKHVLFPWMIGGCLKWQFSQWENDDHYFLAHRIWGKHILELGIFMGASQLRRRRVPAFCAASTLAAVAWIGQGRCWWCRFHPVSGFLF